MARATWERPNEPSIDLLPDGRVLLDGALLWRIDGSGRVTDSHQDPVALLEPEGGVWGPDHKRFGGVEATSAAPPDSGYAWLTMGPDGRMTRYTTDGDAYDAGVWRGCDGAAQRTCMLVSHLITLQGARLPGGAWGVGVGVGVGVGIGIRR
jgi:hypothetical protein